MRDMFLNKIYKSLTCSPKNGEDNCPPKICAMVQSYWINVNIINNKNEILCNIEDVMKNALCSWQKEEKCKKCKSKEKMKEILTEHFPPVLLIKYMRYNRKTRILHNHDIECGIYIKLNKTQYNLKGFMVFIDGRYICFILNLVNNSLDNSDYNKIKKAYILLFERKQDK